MTLSVPVRSRATQVVQMLSTTPGLTSAGVLAVVGLLVFFLNRDPFVEQNVFTEDYLPYARYLTGDGSREVTTYPMWGYPAVIAILGDFMRMAVQYLLALSVVLILLGKLGRGKPVGLAMTIIVAVASVPWFASSSLNSASAIAVPVVWLAGLTIFVRGGAFTLRRAIVAGALIGLALNFRSEFLLLPAVLAIGTIAVSAIGANNFPPSRKYFASALVLMVTAWALLLPWAIFSQPETGGFNLTSTNGGAVSFITLGQLPDNPWGIVHEDSQARRTLIAQGHEGVHPYSAEGNNILRSLFIDSVQSEPGAYARKVVRNFRNALMGGLYFGDWEFWFPRADQARLDASKEKLKEKIGVNPNYAQITKYRSSGVWNESLTPLEYTLVGGAILFVIGTDLLFVLALVTAVVLLARRRLDSLRIYSLLMIVYVVILISLLQYQPRHLNTAWPAMIIFGHTAMAWTLIWVRQRTTRRKINPPG